MRPPLRGVQAATRERSPLCVARRDVDPERGDLAAIAAAAGYADQAHMARDARALTGRTPLQLVGLRAGTLAMADLFKAEDQVPG